MQYTLNIQYFQYFLWYISCMRNTRIWIMLIKSWNMKSVAIYTTQIIFHFAVQYTLPCTISVHRFETQLIYISKPNDWCFRPWFCTVWLYWARDNMGEWDEFLLWIIPLAQDRSLDLLTSSPALYHCTTDASYINEEWRVASCIWVKIQSNT